MNDLINGGFEAFMSVILCFNCRRLYLDKTVKGVSPIPFIFVILWGLWNLYYYPSIGQWWSFAGGLSVVCVNISYCLMMFYYSRIKQNPQL